MTAQRSAYSSLLNLGVYQDNQVYQGPSIDTFELLEATMTGDRQQTLSTTQSDLHIGSTLLCI
jgi:hypothetical protein